MNEPHSFRGGGIAPDPAEYALASLGSCQAITYRFSAEKLDLAFDRVSVNVDGDLDIRGFFGLHDGVRPGFGEVRVEVEISRSESKERYDELQRTVDAHCLVLDIFSNPVPVNHPRPYRVKRRPRRHGRDPESTRRP